MASEPQDTKAKEHDKQRDYGHGQVPSGSVEHGSGDVLSKLKDVTAKSGNAAKQVEATLKEAGGELDEALRARLEKQLKGVQSTTGTTGKLLGFGSEAAEIADGKTSVLDMAEGSLKGNSARHALKGTKESDVAKKAVTLTGVAQQLAKGNEGGALKSGLGLLSKEWNPTEIVETKAREAAQHAVGYVAEQTGAGFIKHPVVKIGVPAVSGLVGGLLAQDGVGNAVEWAGEQMPEPVVKGYEVVSKTVGEVTGAAYARAPRPVQVMVDGVSQSMDANGQAWGEILGGAGSGLRMLAYDAASVVSYPFSESTAMEYAREAMKAEAASKASFGKFGNRVDEAAKTAAYLVGLRDSLHEGVPPAQAHALIPDAAAGEQAAREAAAKVGLSAVGVTEAGQSDRADAPQHGLGSARAPQEQAVEPKRA